MTVNKCVMSYANLIVIGSVHQGVRRFSNVSRGRQCTFMSLSALFICANGCRVSQWPAETVDQILIGDAMYLKVLETKPETFSLTYLPDQVPYVNLSTMSACLTKADRPPNETNQNELPSKATKLSKVLSTFQNPS